MAEGADPNVVNQHGWSPLLGAVTEGRTANVNTLIEGGARLDLAICPDRTAASGPACLLVAAARRGHARVIERLVAAGATPDGAMRDGKPVLVWTAQQGHIAAAAALLGVSGWRPRNHVELAKLYARSLGHGQVLQLLEAYQALRRESAAAYG